MMKPKINRKGDNHKASGYDLCQTPPYAIEPLLPYLNPKWIIWECAVGGGLLLKAFEDHGFTVVGTDIDDDCDFFLVKPIVEDVIITNPPYSTKYAFLERCYELKLPFALLMPVEMLGAKRAQKMFKQHGIQIIFMDKRIDFKMPEKGWEGNGAQFPTAWYTWGLSLPKDMIFTEIDKPPRKMYQELYG